MVWLSAFSSASGFCEIICGYCNVPTMFWVQEIKGTCCLSCCLVGKHSPSMCESLGSIFSPWAVGEWGERERLLKSPVFPYHSFVQCLWYPFFPVERVGNVKQFLWSQRVNPTGEEEEVEAGMLCWMVAKDGGRNASEHVVMGKVSNTWRACRNLEERCFQAERSTSAASQGEAGTHRGNCGAVWEGAQIAWNMTRRSLTPLWRSWLLSTKSQEAILIFWGE